MKDLIKKLIKNDAEAWTDFIRKFQKVIKATVDKFYQFDTSEKEDLYQDVFRLLLENDYKILKAFKNNTDGAMGLYLKQITITNCLKKLKSKNKKIVLPQDELEQINAEFYPDEKIDNNFIKDMLKQIIAGMPIIYRDILMLSLKGLNIQEISVELNLKPKTVQTRLFRAKKNLGDNKKLKSFIT